MPSWAAERYAEGRPRIHVDMLAPVRAHYGGELPAEHGLDLGCGTGLSSLALTDLARRVVAVDVSRTMLRFASRHSRVSYLSAPAEALPLASGMFDLASLACAQHWFEPAPAFGELWRVLREDALLVSYNNSFFGEMRESAAAGRWLRTAYLERYPTPPRQAELRPERAPPGFATDRTEVVDMWVPLRSADLVRYLTTQSNVIAAVESRRETLAEVEAGLREALEPFFREAGRDPGHFRFGGRVTVLRRLGR